MECPHIPRITYGEFGKRLYEATEHRRIPWSGSIEVTERCNLRCIHCYIARDLNDPTVKEKELTTAELSRIMDEAADEGCLTLLLTGGEPLIRPDFSDIYLYSKRRGFLVTLFTNGTMITREIADFLAEYPPRSMEITLYGASEKTYEAVTRVPGSYKRCIRGIELLVDRGVPLSLKTMLMTVNKHELGLMKDFAAGLGMDFRYDASLNFRLEGDSAPARFRLSPEEIVEFDMMDDRRMAEMRKFLEHFGGPPRIPENLYRCGAGIGRFHIDAYGRLSVCIMSREPEYELRKGTFEEGWSRAIPMVMTRKRQRTTPCQSCDVSSLCDQCPGWGLLEWRDPERPVDFLCRTARLRGEALRIGQSGQRAN